MDNFTDYLLISLTEALYATSDAFGEVNADLRAIGGPPRIVLNPLARIDYDRTPKILAAIAELEEALKALKNGLSDDPS